MKALVINGGNEAGRKLVDTLLDDGFTVVVTDEMKPEVFKYLNPSAEFTAYDMDKKALSIFGGFNPDFVYFINAFDYDELGSEKLIGINCMNNRLLDCLDASCKVGIEKFYYVPFYASDFVSDMEYERLKPYRELVHVSENYIKMYNELHALNYAIVKNPELSGKREDIKIFHMNKYRNHMGIAK